MPRDTQTLMLDLSKFGDIRFSDLDSRGNLDGVCGPQPLDDEDAQMIALNVIHLALQQQHPDLIQGRDYNLDAQITITIELSPATTAPVSLEGIHWVACYGNGGEDDAEPYPYVARVKGELKFNPDGSPAWPDSLSAWATELEAWTALQAYIPTVPYVDLHRRRMHLKAVEQQLSICRGECPECGCALVQRNHRLICPNCSGQPGDDFIGDQDLGLDPSNDERTLF